ncbi:MAG: hypothetical protein IIA67_05720 [Planctomycetes bacterium]|nr:hypothetical protein [Planctomycetota bacterium]
MKGSIGLIVAGILGLLAVALNYAYLSSKTAGTESVAFIGVREGVTIKVGDLIKKNQLQPVPVPENNAKYLREFAYLYDDVDSVVGAFRATRTLKAGDLLFHQDYRTPPSEPAFAQHKGHSLMWVSVDSGRFVPSLVDPGDRISFIVPKIERRKIPGKSQGEDDPKVVPKKVIPQSGDADDLIGPFTVASLGNRLASSDVTKGRSGGRSQERQIGIFAEIKGKKFVGEARKLNAAISRSGGRGLGFVLHPRPQQE